MLRFHDLRFRRDPFPIGRALQVFEPATYRDLLASYPPLERFVPLTKVGTKYTLSERFNPREYADAIHGNHLWREFHAWIKSDAFIRSVFEALAQHQIDLGLDIESSRLARRLGLVWDALRGRQNRSPVLTSRFEFSMLPAKGGSVIPHTDGPSKILTLVVSMLEQEEWDSAWGGGTDIVWPKDPLRSFNHTNDQLGFDEIQVIDTFPFEPNQAVIFIKTFNSWHAVRPMTGPDPNVMRRTLTINIENPS